MKKSYETFRRNFENAKRIWNLEDDWITPTEYLPYIGALLGEIDLDPCSTEKANKDFIHAKNFYTKRDDGLNTEVAWTGKVYCFPPTYGRCSYSKKRGSWRWSLRGGAGAMSPSIAWFRRLEREWKLRNIYEALFFSCNHEMMRAFPDMWNYPICIPSKRANLIKGNDYYRFDNPFTWGFFIYLPPPSLSLEPSKKFRDIFSNIGKIIN